jgi:hypothetical protein
MIARQEKTIGNATSLGFEDHKKIRWAKQKYSLAKLLLLPFINIRYLVF